MLLAAPAPDSRRPVSGLPHSARELFLSEIKIDRKRFERVKDSCQDELWNDQERQNLIRSALTAQGREEYQAEGPTQQTGDKSNEKQARKSHPIHWYANEGAKCDNHHCLRKSNQ